MAPVPAITNIVYIGGHKVERSAGCLWIVMPTTHAVVGRRGTFYQIHMLFKYRYIIPFLETCSLRTYEYQSQWIIMTQDLAI
jgi:hypothetical protein